MKNIRSILFFPKELKNQFFEISIQKNHFVLLVLAIAGVLIQGFNIIRVLMLTDSKLSTFNNRVYFGFYISLFIICILYISFYIWWSKKQKLCYYVESACISIFIFWNVGLTIYDTYSSKSVATSVIIICFMVFGALFLHRPSFMLPHLLCSYLLFIACTFHLQTAGSLVNLTIAVFLSGVVTTSRFLSTIADLKQRQNIADIDQVLKAEEDKFRLTCEQYDMLLKYTHDILFVWDLKKDFIKFSDNWHDILGFPICIPKFTLWLADNNALGEKMSQDISKLRELLKNGHIQKEEEILIQSISGIQTWYKMRVLNQFDYHGFPRFGVGILNDITTQKEIIIGLEHEIQKDPLTGILNKTAVEMRINQYLKTLHASQRAAFLVIDLDDFKSINDQFGHPCGDYVLIECAFLLKTSFDHHAEIGRIGGDEFLVFLKDISDKKLYEACHSIMEKMQNICWQGTCIHANCSIGATIVTEHNQTYAQLYYEADDAMYMAKKMGKGKVCVYSKSFACSD